MRWFGLALLGVAVAIFVAIAASRLVSQQIGLASEPISAGDALAPRLGPVHRRRGAPTPAPKPKPAPEREPETAASEPETAAPAPEAPSGPEPGDDGHAGGEGPDD